MADRYTIYEGKFVCQHCGKEVGTLRSYPDSKRLTWMCKEKHLSVVSTQTRKKKQDYERKK